MAVTSDNPEKSIDELIAGITDWRGKTLAAVRKAIRDSDREIVEQFKWMGSPTWYRDGIIAVADAHKEKVKVTFANGAKIADPDKQFNNGLNGNKWRAIDYAEGDKVNATALKGLVRAAIAFNQAREAAKKKPAKPTAKAGVKTAAKTLKKKKA